MSGDPERDRSAADEGFLNRWSRRKAKARAQGADEAPEAPVADAPAEPAEPLDLPDIESLTAESDFKVFMAKGVPQHLRNQALRKLWRLKPSLANLDGLVDYGGDYTRRGVGAGEAVRTAWQVGKGYLRDEPKGPDQVAMEPAPALPDESHGPGAAPPTDEAAVPAPPAPADPATPLAGPVAEVREAAPEPARSADPQRPRARPLPRRG